MKVLYSCLSKSWGGMEMFAITAAQILIRRGIETHILCAANSRIEEESLKRGLTVHTVNSSGSFSLSAVRQLRKLIKSQNYSLIHTQASKDLWVLVPALKAAASPIPLFLTKQVGSYIVKKDLLHKFLYNRLTVAFAISEVIRTNLLDTCPLTPEKIELLHNGTDTSRFDPDKFDKYKVRKEFGVPGSGIAAGMLARFSPGKGHEEFIEAASVLSKKYPDLYFLIVGEASRGEEAYAESIKKLAAESGARNIIFTGYRSDTPDVLAALDIFVFPSHSEAFGIALVEAMSMAKPAVCSAADGVLDIVVDNETGLLFEKKNAKDLELKLEQLVKSKDLRERLGVNARKRAIAMFDMEYLTDRVISFYNKFTSTHSYL